MIGVYYYLVLLNAAVTVGAAVATYWRNRQVGFLQPLGMGFLIFAFWLVGYAQYFAPRSPADSLLWAKITLTASLFNQPFILHGICDYLGKIKQTRWWIGVFYLVAFGFIIILWNGNLLTGLRPAAYMDHYIRYNQRVYPWLGLFYLSTILFGLGVLIWCARGAVGYNRTHIIYFIVAWSIVIGVTYLVVVPIEYGISIQPIGFFLLPINMAFLFYVLAKARLADFNVVVAQVLLHTITLLVVVATTMVFIGSLTVVAPGFMNQGQILFTLFLVVTIAMLLALLLPRFFPQAERAVQDRLQGDRLGYQDVLAGLIKELSAESSIDTLLERVATALHSQMQTSRVLIFLQDPLMDEFRLMAQCGVLSEERDQLMLLTPDGPITQWLLENKDVLVKDEQARVMPRVAWQRVANRLEQLRVTVCVPLLLEGKLTGVFCLGEKINGERFFVSDLRLLTTLATEVALGVRYRRMEEQAIRNNKLVALGTIAAGVAHEIRNPLASIHTFAQLLPTNHDDPEFRNEFSKLVLQDVDRITKVIQSMLSFARPAAMNIAIHTAEELIDEAVMLVQPRLRGKQIEVSKQLPHRLTLSVDKQQILQVLLNILNNAVDALSNGGVIRITTGILPSEKKNNPAEPQLAIIEIADNGPGIPAAARARLFDPFFTTKPEGTGLGLSISQKIVRDHGGFISVSSVEGMGTAFQVHLPLANPVSSG